MSWHLNGLHLNITEIQSWCQCLNHSQVWRSLTFSSASDSLSKHTSVPSPFSSSSLKKKETFTRPTCNTQTSAAIWTEKSSPSYWFSPSVLCLLLVVGLWGSRAPRSWCTVGCHYRGWRTGTWVFTGHWWALLSGLCGTRKDFLKRCPTELFLQITQQDWRPHDWQQRVKLILSHAVTRQVFKINLSFPKCNFSTWTWL